ncbi:MAG TPA: HAD family acid phosphatase [Gemmatimonadaceae bacterium]
MTRHRTTALLALTATILLAPARGRAQQPAPDRVPAVPPSQEDPRIHDVVASASPARIEADIRRLVAFGTRHTLSDTMSTTRGIGAARRWIYDEFRRISASCGGCLEVRYVSEVVKGNPQSRIRQDLNVVNVIAIQRGKVDPNRYVLLSGDIDSRVSDVMNATADSPGANDNASGVAATLEAARLLTKYQPDASIVYAALSGEEQGLFGGETVARLARSEGWDLEAVINNDMVGNTAGIDSVVENTRARVFAPGLPPTMTAAELRRVLTTGGELDTPSRQLARYIASVAERYFPHLTVDIIYRLDRFGRGGHHTPFFNQGFPAVRLMEAHENYDRQHQDLRTENGVRYGDVIEGVDFPYAAKMTALDAATLISLAWAPATPDSVSIRGAVQPSTTLRWKPVNAPDLAGYRVYWRRPTDANWTQSRFVGTVTEFTLKNVVIDDYFFGVAAVDREGHESLVAFPGAVSADPRRTVAAPPAATTPAAAPAPAAAALTDSARSLLLPPSIRWTVLSAEHRAAYLQAYREATRRVNQLAAGKRRGRWAVILDADETVLDNSPHELELARANATYNPRNWAEWVGKAAAPALPGAAAFIERVHALGGRVVIVTNRAEPLCPDTRENFRKLGIAVDAVLCGSGDKNPRFQSVSRGSAGIPAAEVVMWVGDNIQDFPALQQREVRTAPASAYAEFGNRFIILPNPMYGSWDRIPVP